MGGRGSGRPRSTACKCGLPYSHVDSRGQRKCRTCEAARARKRYGPTKINRIAPKFVVRQYKIALKHCVICKVEINETNFMMFALDHRDPSQKLFNLSQVRSEPLDIVLAECEKCDLMCHNCHHVKTHQSRDHLVRRDAPTTQAEYLPLLLLMQDAE